MPDLMIEQLSRETIMVLLLAAGAIILIIGTMTDWIMGGRGFGPLGNGLLIAMGCGLGLVMQTEILGPVRTSDASISAIIAGISATVFLVTFSMAKHWLQD